MVRSRDHLWILNIYYFIQPSKQYFVYVFMAVTNTRHRRELVLVSRMSVVIHDHAPMWKNPATVFVLLQSNFKGNLCLL